MGHRHILEILDLGVILLDGVIEDCNQKGLRHARGVTR